MCVSSSAGFARPCPDVIDRAELSGAALEVAPRLLGATLVSTTSGEEVRARITEVEAYEGAQDPASHAFRGPTARTMVMFGPPGHLYCYFVYGMHWCANVTCGSDGTAAAVLLRAAAIEDSADPRVASGPARLARALGLTGRETGLDLLDPASPVRLISLTHQADFRTGPRVGVSTARTRPWRFWLPDEPSVSVYRPHKPKKRTAGQNERP